MEHIGEALQNLSQETAMPSQKIINSDPELTLEEKREKLRKSLGVSSLYNTFENFKPVAGTKEALATFKALASGKTEWKMLLCYGGVGNGKTHLCEATAITLYKRGLFCQVKTMSKIMGALKESMGREAMTPYDVLLERFCQAQHLIIDDVGMGGSGSEWEWGQLEDIVVYRHHEQLFTILTTNLGIKPNPDFPDIPFISERIVSRFQDPDFGRIVLNKGEDYRRLKGG